MHVFTNLIIIKITFNDNYFKNWTKGVDIYIERVTFKEKKF